MRKKEFYVSVLVTGLALVMVSPVFADDSLLPYGSEEQYHRDIPIPVPVKPNVDVRIVSFDNGTILIIQEPPFGFETEVIMMQRELYDTIPPYIDIITPKIDAGEIKMETK